MGPGTVPHLRHQRHREEPDDVNFWRPSGQSFRALHPRPCGAGNRLLRGHGGLRVLLDDGTQPATSANTTTIEAHRNWQPRGSWPAAV